MPTYTLIAAAPMPDPTRVRLETLVEGEVPSPINPPKGCAFQPRCPLAVERCRIEVPLLVPMADGRSRLKYRVTHGSGNTLEHVL